MKHGDMVSLEGRRHGPPDAAVAARVGWSGEWSGSAAAPASARSSSASPQPWAVVHGLLWDDLNAAEAGQLEDRKHWGCGLQYSRSGSKLSALFPFTCICPPEPVPPWLLRP